jgi:hypothetical protein
MVTTNAVRYNVANAYLIPVCGNFSKNRRHGVAGLRGLCCINLMFRRDAHIYSYQWLYICLHGLNLSYESLSQPPCLSERSTRIMIPTPLLAIKRSFDTSLLIVSFQLLLNPNIWKYLYLFSLLIKLSLLFLTPRECLTITPVSWGHKGVVFMLQVAWKGK